MSASLDDVIWQQGPKSIQILIGNLGSSGADAAAHAQATLGADSQTLTVTLGSGKPFRIWKLYNKISDLKMEPPGAGGTSVSIQLTKEMEEKTNPMWPVLMRVPIQGDAAFMGETELDALLAAEVKPLPEPPAAAGASSVEEAFDDAKLDALQVMQLNLLNSENKEIDTMLRNYQEGKEKAGSDYTPTDEDEDRVLGLHRLSEVNVKLRALLSLPSTLQNMLKIQDLEIFKAKVIRLGLKAQVLETEEYKQPQEEDERAMTTEDLINRGMKQIQDSNNGNMSGVEDGIHKLRLAALQRNDATASVILFHLYGDMKAHGLAAYFLVRRARMDDADPVTNGMLATFHDKGFSGGKDGGKEANVERLFPPWTGLAVYYYQRAARAGTHCLIDLSNLWRAGASHGMQGILKAMVKAGSTTYSGRPDPALQAMWLNYAAERGSGPGNFIKCHLHIEGSNPYVVQSQGAAMECWMKAVAALPQLAEHSDMMQGAIKQMPADDPVTGCTPKGDISAPTKLRDSGGGGGAVDPQKKNGVSGEQKVVLAVAAIGVCLLIPPVRRALWGYASGLLGQK